MAVVMECEQCGRRAKVDDGFIRLPVGWIELRERCERETAQAYLCGHECTADYVKGLAANARERAAEQAAELPGVRCVDCGQVKPVKVWPGLDTQPRCRECAQSGLNHGHEGASLRRV